MVVIGEWAVVQYLLGDCSGVIGKEVCCQDLTQACRGRGLGSETRQVGGGGKYNLLGLGVQHASELFA